jgi:hypothetical protein
MATESVNVLSAAEKLTLSLEAVAGALAAADTVGLLAAEECLSLALADISRVRAVGAHERGAVAYELGRAKATLARCRVLGQSLSDATQATLLALGISADYERSGARMPDAAGVVARGSALKARM